LSVIAVSPSQPAVTPCTPSVTPHSHFDTPQDLAEQMLAYIETRNQTATPFKWTYAGKVLNA
jgi:hypothetical protein